MKAMCADSVEAQALDAGPLRFGRLKKGPRIGVAAGGGPVNP